MQKSTQPLGDATLILPIMSKHEYALKSKNMWVRPGTMGTCTQCLVRQVRFRGGVHQSLAAFLQSCRDNQLHLTGSFFRLPECHKRNVLSKIGYIEPCAGQQSLGS